ncbi:MAG: peptidylprolyl isomerase, partial [Bacteroidetes bacterium]|nr:peptidylprolyl isomerase [Bacteroidota bacterium]
DDYSKIAQRALEEKKESVLEKWFATKIQTYYIMVDDDFKDCKSMEKWVEAARVNGNTGKR